MSKSGSQGPKSVGASQRDVMNYSPPTGRAPGTSGPGLGGSVYRQGTQGPTTCDNDETGSPGLHGDNCGVEGSQEMGGKEERD